LAFLFFFKLVVFPPVFYQRWRFLRAFIGKISTFPLEELLVCPFCILVRVPTALEKILLFEFLVRSLPCLGFFLIGNQCVRRPPLYGILSNLCLDLCVLDFFSWLFFLISVEFLGCL